jgi:tetratricopeptide (TPR) repeat protein
MLKSTIGLCICALSLTAQTVGKPDNCAPPPGSVPPDLPAKLLPGMGTVNFPITTRSAEAQAFFNQGVAQMHSFWSREAERSFLQAAKLDPAAPMPHWGIAMVASGDYRPGFQLSLVNGAQPKPRKPSGAPQGGSARAAEAAKKAHQLASAPGAATEVEKLYIAAVMARRDPAAKDSESAYTEALRSLVQKHPKEIEARTYLALQIMSGFELPGKSPRKGSSEAVAILRQLLHEAPDHPGVHHYVIHGWEGSSFAKDAWPSCERYGNLANNIPHGLHMPGHIYAQTGRWSDAAKAFHSAARNEVYWMEADSLTGNGHHGHNVHFQATAHSFEGDFEKALATARSLFAFKETPREAKQVDNYRTAWRQGWFAVLRTLVQHEKWDLILDGTTLPAYDKPREKAWRHWAMALAHSAGGNRKAAEVESEAFSAALKAYKDLVKQDPPDPLRVARSELDGHLALAAGKPDKAFKLLERASTQERALRYNEPPNYPRPVLEILGKLAVRHGRQALAEKAFQAALEQYPESAISKSGLRALGLASNSGS